MPADCPPLPPARVPAARALAASLEEALRGRTPASSERPGRRAAVLIALYDRDELPHLLLTKRSDDVPAHPGQVSLPGGVIDAGDHDARAAALRETHEEVGIPPRDVRILGELDDVHTMVSGFIIRPVVAVVEGTVEVVPSDAEVARVMHVPLVDLLAADAAIPGEPAPLALRYPLLGEDVWGATARVLRNFCRLTRCALSDRGPAGTGAGADRGR